MNSYLLTLGVTVDVARSIGFVKKLDNPVYIEREGSVEIAFTSDVPIELYRTKVSVQKKRLGCVGNVILLPPTPSTATSSTVTEASTTTLAVCTRLAYVKDACSSLSPGDEHALRLWLARRAETHQTDQSANPAIVAMLSEKRKMAMGFSSLPASEWGTVEAPYNPGMRCECTCGCRVWGVDRGRCFSCARFLCPHCHPSGPPPRPAPGTLEAEDRAKLFLDFEQFNPADRWRFYKKYTDGLVNRCCHECVNKPKLIGVPEPPSRYGSLYYYFNGPFEQKSESCTLDPMYGVLANRDVRLDPRLLYVENLYKHVRFEDVDARRQYPLRWERGFTVLAVLGGLEDSKVTASINLECFMMNPVWKLDGGIKMASEFMTLRANWDCVGLLIKTQPLIVLPPQYVTAVLPSPPVGSKRCAPSRSRMSATKIPMLRQNLRTDSMVASSIV